MANATSLKGDIVSKEDVQNLVTRFYAKVRNDDQLAHHFATVDWDHHTPVIVKFWSMILHGELGYKGNPLAKHLPMKLTKADFERWLLLFTNTVDELFSGAKAEEAKQRAQIIASMFQFKMNISQLD